jgi:hypothetical protein
MKTTITLLILILVTPVFGQDTDFDQADSLARIEFSYETLDSNAVRLLNKKININTRSFFDYYSGSSSRTRLAYCTNNKNKWTSILLPFENVTLTEFKQINIDKKGLAELEIKGASQDYGSGGGTGIRWLIIINIDSVPTQILKIFYGCWDESFGDRENNGQGHYYKEYERKITVSENGIIISPLNKKKYPFEECGLTEIPSGTYILNGGEIRKK